MLDAGSRRFYFMGMKEKGKKRKAEDKEQEARGKSGKLKNGWRNGKR